MPDQNRSVAAREARVRRIARRMGLSIHKDRSRLPSMDRLGGYMLVNDRSNAIVAGERFDLDLEQLEAELLGVSA